MASEATHHLLLYDYVQDMSSRRGPYREAHLARIASERESGRVVMAGALGDPPRGAAIVFRGVDAGFVEDFVRGDSYVEAGLGAALARGAVVLGLSGARGFRRAGPTPRVIEYFEGLAFVLSAHPGGPP